MNQYTPILAERLQLAAPKIDNTLALLDEGCTIPFIARYRKERTQSLNEVEIAAIAEGYQQLKELAKRKETILKTIEAQNALTPTLQQRIQQCWDATTLEDLYLPYNPTRRTKAQIAREKGLEPLALLIMQQQTRQPREAAKPFLRNGITTTDEALAGAIEIIAEKISEDEYARQQVRRIFKQKATITSKVIKTKQAEEGAQKFADYFDFSEPLKRCSSHRLLAMRRGEHEGYLRVSIDAPKEDCLYNIVRKYAPAHNACQALLHTAIDEAFKRFIRPAIETEFANASKEAADKSAINVFAENLRQLLLSPPLGQRRVLAIDPGLRTGCKVVCLDAQGNLLAHTVVHIVGTQATQALSQLQALIAQHKIEAIAVGNGTGSRETIALLQPLQQIPVYMVSEDGASIYSASPLAREEFPELDLTVRGAISIGRRLIDPLAELVKLDPKSIGVGQYQHDVNQPQLRQALQQTVEYCVNSVGVNLNTASKHLLMYVSGLGATLADNIIAYRQAHGAFQSRETLKQVPRLGAVAFQQCAGFLRIPNAQNPLDNSAVHPERYALVEQMARQQNCSVADLIGNEARIAQINLEDYVTPTIGLPTLRDIVAELKKPGLDPRATLQTFAFDERVHTLAGLREGMVLPGIVTNITNFGAFVDIGVHQDGLIHISEIANHYVSDPNEVLKLHQQLHVKVIQVDSVRKRISLSLKQV